MIEERTESEKQAFESGYKAAMDLAIDVLLGMEITDERNANIARLRQAKLIIEKC